MERQAVGESGVANGRSTRRAITRKCAPEDAGPRDRRAARSVPGGGRSGRVEGAFHGINGLIANDKFCLTRRGRLALNWWRRPLRLRDRPAAVAYLHEDPVHRGGAYEAVMARAPTTAGEPGRGAAVGSGLPAPAALGDADRAGGGP